jgi:hypothetical protein
MSGHLLSSPVFTLCVNPPSPERDSLALFFISRRREYPRFARGREDKLTGEDLGRDDIEKSN